MRPVQPTNRELKPILQQCLLREDFSGALSDLLGRPARYPERRLINPLLSFLYSREPLLKWRAVSGIGLVTDRLAGYNMEGARVIVRRLMWNLNDESGGIGWGSPEAMGEILARNFRLAGEYYSILLSYLIPGGNYLEHKGLQPGALWGVGRLARSNDALLKPATGYLLPYLQSEDVNIRGHAVWAALPLRDAVLEPVLDGLQSDRAVLTLYRWGQLEETTIQELLT